MIAIWRSSKKKVFLYPIMDSDVKEILSGGLQRIESGKMVELAQGEFIFKASPYG